MVDVPTPTPDTAPLVALTVATPVLLLVHVPENVADVNVVVQLLHSVSTPPIAPGKVTTVATIVRRQPVANVYLIVELPVATPVTTPVPATTVAFDGTLLVHVPPDGDELSVAVLPIHAVADPVIADGDASTVAVRVEAHPVLTV
jgi:hypothetical protein